MRTVLVIKQIKTVKVLEVDKDIKIWLKNAKFGFLPYNVDPCILYFFFTFVFIHLQVALYRIIITKTSLFKYTEIFTTKNWNFSDKNSDIFSYFCSKHRLWVLVRTASARRFYRVPTIYVFDRNKKNNVYPCKPQFYYIKVGFKGVNII